MRTQAPVTAICPGTGPSEPCAFSVALTSCPCLHGHQDGHTTGGSCSGAEGQECPPKQRDQWHFTLPRLPTRHSLPPDLLAAWGALSPRLSPRSAFQLPPEGGLAPPVPRQAEPGGRTRSSSGPARAQPAPGVRSPWLTLLRGSCPHEAARGVTDGQRSFWTSAPSRAPPSRLPSPGTACRRLGSLKRDHGSLQLWRLEVQDRGSAGPAPASGESAPGPCPAAGGLPAISSTPDGGKQHPNLCRHPRLVLPCVRTCLSRGPNSPSRRAQSCWGRAPLTTSSSRPTSRGRLPGCVRGDFSLCLQPTIRPTAPTCASGSPPK